MALAVFLGSVKYFKVNFVYASIERSRYKNRDKANHRK